MGNVKLPHGYGIEKVGVKLQVRLEIWKLCLRRSFLGSGGKNMSSSYYDIFMFEMTFHVCYDNSQTIGILQVVNCGSPSWTTTE